MPKLHTDPPFYDWNEIRDEVEKNLGKDIRDYAGKFKHDGDGLTHIDAPYLDFWHLVVDFHGSDIHNGSVTLMNFEDLYEHKPEAWVREICDEFIRVLGPENADDGFYRIKHEW